MLKAEKEEALKMALQVTIAYAGSASDKGPDYAAITLESVFDKIVELKNKQV
jgi:hypothetical protein